MNQQQFDEHMNELFLRDNKKPIDKAILRQLPRSVCDGELGGEGAHACEKQCSICMTDYARGEELLTLLCFHKFHAECVETWFESQDWCPICRMKIADQ